jgi:hypothetical protein
MTEGRERKRSLADAVKQAAVMATSDPLGSFCVLLVFGKFWKVGLILLAAILMVGLLTGFVILWIKHWDI